LVLHKNLNFRQTQTIKSLSPVLKHPFSIHHAVLGSSPHLNKSLMWLALMLHCLTAIRTYTRLFLPAQQYASMGISCRRVPVRLPVCLSTTHQYTHIQPFYGSMDFVRDNMGEPVPEETFTHSHLSWSSIVPYLLLPSNTNNGICPV